MLICRLYVLRLSRTSRYTSQTCAHRHLCNFQREKRIKNALKHASHVYPHLLHASRRHCQLTLLLFSIRLRPLNHARFVNTLGSNIRHCFPAFKLPTLSLAFPTCAWLVHAQTVGAFTLQVSFYSMFSMTTNHSMYRKLSLSLLPP